MEQIVNTTSIAPSLYDCDLNLLVEHTLAHLKARDFGNLDMATQSEEEYGGSKGWISFSALGLA